MYVCMAAVISWHRYGTEFRHCHRVYTGAAVVWQPARCNTGGGGQPHEDHPLTQLSQLRAAQGSDRLPGHQIHRRVGHHPQRLRRMTSRDCNWFCVYQLLALPACYVRSRVYVMVRRLSVGLISSHLLFFKNSCQTQLCTKFIHIHTRTRLTALCPGLPGWAGTRKVKTNLDFTEARDSKWQWHQLGHMQVCTSL